MKYAVWLVRLWYAAWMIPAGLEHFIHIFPQPGYYTTRPLAHEMLFALLDSHMFVRAARPWSCSPGSRSCWDSLP